MLEAPIIPSNVTNMRCTFEACTSLTGDVVVNANPDSYGNCFKDTVKPITLIGSSSEQTKINLAGIANNGNAAY